jgi:hypothetical protein
VIDLVSVRAGYLLRSPREPTHFTSGLGVGWPTRPTTDTAASNRVGILGLGPLLDQALHAPSVGAVTHG